jgi:diguanylate cyclase (GGDEF)-like protein
VSVWYGGLGPGLLAAILGVIACLVFYVPWTDSASAGLQQYGLQLLVFAGTTGLIIWLFASRQRAERAAAYQALHDPLTGLPNRRLFRDRLEQLVVSGRRTRRPFALIVLDLDGFKRVNDSLGHLEGDALLRHVARRLRDHMRASDTVARLGGDEFALLLPDTDELGAVTKLSRLIHLLLEPFSLSSGTITVSASLGLALYPDHGTTPDDLFSRADTMMYEVKRGEVLGSALDAPVYDEPDERIDDVS